MDYGLDTLALPKYFRTVAQVLPKGWWFSTFGEAFGDPFKRAIPAVLDKGNAAGLKVNLLWSDNHQFGDKDIPKIKKMSKLCERIAHDYQISVEICPFTEHNLKNPDKYLDIVKDIAPSCTPLNTPWQGAFSKRYKNEIHGSHNSPSGEYNFSFDGTACVDSNVEAYKMKHASCDVFWFWDAPFNLKYEPDDTTPRPDRTYKPSKALFESIIFLATDKGQTKLPPNWLLKTHAETKPQPDPRADHPVIICPVKGNRIALKSNGHIVGYLDYYGTYIDGRYRYYCTQQWGYEIAQKYGICDVIIAGKSYGKVNMGFRQGAFHD